ncbi:hypothetical protein NUW54_g11528 [Trametes sanguinea]|uniref:Uncharacterized protein n=1 Tax=Trametes sanguinea TaxID=158606 RepID=A0ACC1ND13_9APHY|nr:hypothetical protein NUW54_g11528 [Trametes sanguinea]
MPPKGYVRCLCDRCKGEWQPRTTRNGHYRTQRLKKSASSSRRKARPSNKSQRTGVGQSDVSSIRATHERLDDWVEAETSTASTTNADIIDVHPAVNPNRANERPETSSRTSTSIPTHTGASSWAFISSPLPSTTTSSGALASTGVVVDSISASTSSTEQTNTFPEPQTDDSAEPIYDDEWDEPECEATGGQGLPPLPPPLSSTSPSNDSPLAANATQASSGSIAASGSNCPAPTGIPLNTDAMARLNDPDPFASSSTVQSPSVSTVLKTGHPAVMLAMLLVAWLHIIAHLPFRFCDVVLTVIGYILAEAGQSSLVPAIRTTLTSCLSATQLEPRFCTYPTCPECLKVYPESVAEDPHACCTSCGHALFEVPSESPPRRKRRRARHAKAKPLLRTPAKSLTEQLALLLKEPGFEDALSAWRKRARSPDILNDFFDGAISHELLGPDGKPFFRHDLTEEPDGELRVGVALGVDWYAVLLSLLLAA